MTHLESKIIPRLGLIPGPTDLKRLKGQYREFGIVGPALTGRETLARVLRERLGSGPHTVKVFDSMPADWSPEQVLAVYWIPGSAGAPALRLSEVEIAAFFRSHQLGELPKELIEEIREHGRAVPSWLNGLAATCLRRQVPLNDETWPELRVEADRLFCAEAVARLSDGGRAILEEARAIRYHHARRGEVLRRMNGVDLAMLQFHRVVDSEWKLDLTLRGAEGVPSGRSEPANSIEDSAPIRDRMEFLDGLIWRGDLPHAAALVDAWMWDLLAECTVTEFCELTRLVSPHLSLLTFQFRAHWLAHAGEWETGTKEIEERLGGVAKGSDEWVRLTAWSARVHRMGGELAKAIELSGEALKLLDETHSPLTQFHALRERAHAIRYTQPSECASLLLRAERVPLSKSSRVDRFGAAEIESTRALWFLATNHHDQAIPILHRVAAVFESLKLVPDRLLTEANLTITYTNLGADNPIAKDEAHLAHAHQIRAKYVASIFTDELLRKAYFRGEFRMLLRISKKALLAGEWLRETVARRAIALVALKQFDEAASLIDKGRKKGLFLDRYWKPIIDFYSLLCQKETFTDEDWTHIDRFTVEADENSKIALQVLFLETSLEQWRIEGTESVLSRNASMTFEARFFRDPLVIVHRLFVDRRITKARDELAKIYAEASQATYRVGAGVLVPFLALTYLATGNVSRARELLSTEVETNTIFFDLAKLILSFLEGKADLGPLINRFVAAQPKPVQERAHSFVMGCFSLCGIRPSRQVMLSSSEGQSLVDIELARTRMERSDGISIDLTRRSANVFGQTIEEKSNPILFRLVELMAKKPGSKISMQDAARWIWDERFNPLVHVPRIHTLIFRLRDITPINLRGDIHVSSEGLMITRSVKILLASPVKAPGELTDIGEWILSYVKKRGRISNHTIARSQNCSPSTAKREAKKLAERGLIVLRGKGRGAVYESV